jgi:signal transduction histidine kinase
VFGPINPRPYWDYARDIHDSGKHLLSIINQILDISRIDAGERELRDSIVDIPKVVGACLEIISPKAKTAGLNIVEVGLDKAYSLVGEEVAIKQMLINILSNAVKFTPAGGRITVSVEPDDMAGLRLSISDTGVGLDDSEIEKAMSPFGVLDGRANKSTSGIGLGLSLVQALMKLHGGRLEIFSQKGIGTTVTMIFPAERIQK